MYTSHFRQVTYLSIRQNLILGSWGGLRHLPCRNSDLMGPFESLTSWGGLRHSSCEDSDFMGSSKILIVQRIWRREAVWDTSDLLQAFEILTMWRFWRHTAVWGTSDLTRSFEILIVWRFWTSRGGVRHSPCRDCCRRQSRRWGDVWRRCRQWRCWWRRGPERELCWCRCSGPRCWAPEINHWIIRHIINWVEDGL